MRYAKIGGQAVMEGVMMRYKHMYAVTVRKPDGELETKTERYLPLTDRAHVQDIPVLRGVFAFLDSLVLGMSTLTWSAGFFEEEPKKEETGRKTGKSKAASKAADAGSAGEKAADKKADDKKTAGNGDSKGSFSDSLFMGLTVIFAIAIAVGLFMVVPFLVSNLFGKVIESRWILGIIEGVIRVILFMGYLIMISRMKDIQRVFMYHGAEHKSINCIEHGEELTPENAMKHSRLHRRCGTSFLLIVIFLSVLFFILFFAIVPVSNLALKIVLRVLLVPVIAGVSYEIIQWAGQSENVLTSLISKPGMAMQKLTTREPTPDMIEAAIASIEAIYDWRAFQAGSERENDEADKKGGCGVC